VNDLVFCIIRIQQETSPGHIEGTCYWLLELGNNARSIGPELYNRATAVMGNSTNAVRTAVRRTSGAIERRMDISPGACTLAAIKAMLDARVLTQFAVLVDDGYFPIGYECIPSTPNSGYAGYVIVAFKFRNLVGDGVSLLVPVKLSTAATVEGPAAELGVIREVSDSDHATAKSSVEETRSDCISVKIKGGKACLSVPYAGDICIKVPSEIPNGTVAEACFKTCKKFGIVCGVKAWISVLGEEVASQSWGCC
jgi:hypothetical protein